MPVTTPRRHWIHWWISGR